MEPELTNAPEEQVHLPFDNLFLNTGVVNGINQWWMYIFGICSAVFGYFLFQVFLLFPLLSAALANGITRNQIMANPEILFDPDKTGINKNILLALLLGMFVFALLGLVFALKVIHKKPLRSIVTAYDKPRYNRFFFSFGLWTIMIILITIVSYFTDKGSITLQFKPADFAILLLISVVLLPIQTSFEELFFRGYMLQGLSQVFKNGIMPLVITSLLFGSVHMSNPEAKTYGWEVMLPYYSLFGFFLGAITLIDEGLELALGIHCANNLISGLLVTSPNGVLKTDAVFMSSSENPLAELAIWLVMATITFIIFWRKYSWKNFNLLIK